MPKKKAAKKASKKATKSTMTKAQALAKIGKMAKAIRSDVTKSFYAQLSKGASPAQALQRAKFGAERRAAAGSSSAGPARKKTAKKRAAKKTSKKKVSKKRVAKKAPAKKAAAKKAAAKKVARKKTAKKASTKRAAPKPPAAKKAPAKKRAKKKTAQHTSAAQIIKGAKTGAKVSKVTKSAVAKTASTRRLATPTEAKMVRVNELINKAKRNNYRLWVCSGIKPRGCGGSTKYNRTRTVAHLA